eukprot:768759-Hanusia_phi.AAC.26
MNSCLATNNSSFRSSSLTPSSSLGLQYPSPHRILFRSISVLALISSPSAVRLPSSVPSLLSSLPPRLRSSPSSVRHPTTVPRPPTPTPLQAHTPLDYHPWYLAVRRTLDPWQYPRAAKPLRPALLQGPLLCDYPTLDSRVQNYRQCTGTGGPGYYDQVASGGYVDETEGGTGRYVDETKGVPVGSGN